MGMEEQDSEKKVEIVLKTIGPARPSRLLLPSSIKVRDLRRLVAGNVNLPIENLSLILRGCALCDMKNGDELSVQLNDGDSLIVAVKPKPPVKDEYDNDDDDEDLKFRLPHSSSRWKKWLYTFLHDNLKLPASAVCVTIICLLADNLNWVIQQVYALFQASSEGVASHNFVVYPCSCRPQMGSRTFNLMVRSSSDVLRISMHHYALNPSIRFDIILATGFCLILFNLGKRQAGDIRYDQTLFVVHY
ncbi:hypothetical protein V8G54_004958 [Vigna mungo]|uniref:Ubiquitin-like domain-containing protein n=1 Tax=Vigna mungo TaxID=3915 RepID=A0AAQ3PHI7_VIGMU